MNEDTDSSRANRQIARAAGTVMAAIVLGQVLGLIRGVLVAQAFPANELDAFFAANRVSETLFVLIAAGALGSAFIPTFTGMLAQGNRRAAWRLASALGNLIVLILTVLALLAALFAPAIVRYLLAPGFSADPSQFALTVELLRLQLASVILFGLGGLVVGVLNAHQIFFVPALAPSMYQLGLIFGVVVLGPGYGIRGLAWGVVLGATLYLLLQVPALLRVGRAASLEIDAPWYTPTLGLEEPSVREVVRLMLPRVAGIAVVQLNFWVNTWLASLMRSGSVAALQYGFSLMLMAQAAIAQSVAIAAMPTFSAQFALGRHDDLRSSLTAALRGVLLLAAPASAGLILLRKPIVTLLYQRGHFDAYMTSLVAWALLWFAAGLIGHSMLEVLTRAYYAQRDTRTPVIVGASAMGLNVLLSIGLSSLFLQVGWMPHGGLALANSLATALEMSTLLFLVRRKLGGLDLRPLRSAALYAGLGVTAMCAVLIPFSRVVGSVAAATLGGVVLGSTVYVLVLAILRVPELSAVISAMRRRLLR